MRKYIELTEYDNNGRTVIFADSIQGLCRVRDGEYNKEFTEVMVSGYTFIVNEPIDEILERMEKVIEADKEQEDTYKYLLHGAKSLVKEHPDLVRDIWNCSSCEHTEDECKDCYSELGYKNNKLKRDTEAVKEFVESDTFEKLMEGLDKQDRAATEDAEHFLRDIKEQEE